MSCHGTDNRRAGGQGLSASLNGQISCSQGDLIVLRIIRSPFSFLVLNLVPPPILLSRLQFYQGPWYKTKHFATQR